MKIDMFQPTKRTLGPKDLLPNTVTGLSVASTNASFLLHPHGGQIKPAVPIFSQASRSGAHYSRLRVRWQGRCGKS